MNTIRAKVRLNRIINTDYGSVKQYDAEFHFVYSDVDGSENKKYWEATPSGEFTLNGLKSDLGLIPGKEYYIDINPATSKQD